MGFIVAMDGPAGSGKGTVAREVSKILGLVNLDTGATYRCVALESINRGIKLDEEDKIEKMLDDLNIDIKIEDYTNKIYLNNVEVTQRIREQDVTNIVSQISNFIPVRSKMVEIQRKMAEGKDVIMEGRDITTVVFPNANIKIYLDASEEIRAKRRFEQNKEKGINTSYKEILKSIRTRDTNDKAKEVGALKIDKDAIVIDTTNMDIGEMIEKVKSVILQKYNKI